MSSPNIITLTEANFSQEVLAASVPVLVDFWADWCGPCKMIAPVLDEIADARAGVYKIGKVDADTQQALAAQFGIRALPTLLIFKGGEVRDQIVGATSKPALEAKLAAVG